MSKTNFSSQVFCEYSAYFTAASSSLARKATSRGFPLPIDARVSCTSWSSFFAIVSARMTLQVFGGAAMVWGQEWVSSWEQQRVAVDAIVKGFGGGMATAIAALGRCDSYTG